MPPRSGLVSALTPLLCPPLVEQPFLLELPLHVGLLQGALPFEVQLSLHRPVLGRLGLLDPAFLCLPVDRRVADHAAGGTADEHGRRAAAEDGAARAGTECRTADGSDTGASRAGLAARGGKRRGSDKQDGARRQARRPEPCVIHPHFPTSARTAPTISSNERASSWLVSATLNAFILNVMTSLNVSTPSPLVSTSAKLFASCGPSSCGVSLPSRSASSPLKAAAASRTNSPSLTRLLPSVSAASKASSSYTTPKSTGSGSF